MDNEYQRNELNRLLDEYGNNLLHYLIKNNDVDMITYFINKNVSMYRNNMFGHSPLYYLLMFRKDLHKYLSKWNISKKEVDDFYKQISNIFHADVENLLNKKRVWLFTRKDIFRKFFAGTFEKKDNLVNKYLPAKLVNILHKEYEKNNLYHSNNYGGLYGTYFSMFYGTLNDFDDFILYEKRKRNNHLDGHSYFVYDAETLFEQIIKYVKNTYNETPDYYFIYANYAWNYGTIVDSEEMKKKREKLKENGILDDLVYFMDVRENPESLILEKIYDIDDEKSIENKINNFLHQLVEKNYVEYGGELIIRWPVANTLSNGLVKVTSTPIESDDMNDPALKYGGYKQKYEKYKKKYLLAKKKLLSK